MPNRERNHEQQFPRLVDPQTGRDSPKPPKSPDALLTRAEAAAYIDRELGRPMAFSTMQKLCALREGPPVAEYWGRRPLYSRADLKAWVEARGGKTRPVKESQEPQAADGR